jgi:hypothetical protein
VATPVSVTKGAALVIAGGAEEVSLDGVLSGGIIGAITGAVATPVSVTKGAVIGGIDCGGGGGGSEEVSLGDDAQSMMSLDIGTVTTAGSS